MSTILHTVCSKVNILGVPFSSISFAGLMATIESAIRSGQRIQIVPGSVDHVMKARRNPEFQARLSAADFVIADGVPILWAARWLGKPLPGRVSGTDVARECAAVSARTRRAVVIVGGRHEVNIRAADAMEQSYPGSRIVPINTPFPLDEAASRLVVKNVRDLNPAILLLALGAPRQEDWIARHLSRTGANVGIGVGSAMDILGGDKPRAPRWMCKCGLEWLHRLRLEPRRLARRYMIEDPPFFLLLAREILASKARSFLFRH